MAIRIRLSRKQWFCLIVGNTAALLMALAIGSQLAEPRHIAPVVRLLDTGFESCTVPLDLTGDRRFSAFRPAPPLSGFHYKHKAEEIRVDTKYLGNLGADFFLVTWSGASAEGRRIVALNDEVVVICKAEKIEVVMSPN